MSSKVKLLVGQEGNQQSFLVAPAVLAFHSEVFEAMFFGPNADGSDVFEFPEDDPSTFSTLLRYSETFELKVWGIDETLKVYHLFDKYLMFDAKSKCVHRLIERIEANNVVEILQRSEELQEDHLSYSCWLYILKHTHEILLSGLGLANVKTLSAIVRQNVLCYSRDVRTSNYDYITTYYNCEEIEVYNGIVYWGKNELLRRKEGSNCLRAVVEPFISEIRFLTMSPKEFAGVVCGNGVLTDREELEVLRAINNKIPTVPSHLNNSRKERTIFSDASCHLINCTGMETNSQKFIIERFRAKSHNLYVLGILLINNFSFEVRCTLRIHNVTKKKEVKTTLLVPRTHHAEILSKSAILVAKGEIFEITLQSDVQELCYCVNRKCTDSPFLERVLDSSLAENKTSHSRGIVALPLDA